MLELNNRLRLATNLSDREAVMVSLLQVAAAAVGMSPADIAKSDEDGLVLEDQVIVSDTTVTKRVIDGEREAPAWFVGRFVHYPGSYREPPDVDVAELLVTEHASAAAHAAVAVLMDDRIGAALEAEGERRREEEERRVDEQLAAMGCGGWRCGNRDCPVHAPYEAGAEPAGFAGDDDRDYFRRRNEQALRRAGL